MNSGNAAHKHRNYKIYPLFGTCNVFAFFMFSPYAERQLSIVLFIFLKQFEVHQLLRNILKGKTSIRK